MSWPLGVRLGTGTPTLSNIGQAPFGGDAAVHHQIRSASPQRCSMQSRKPLKVVESAVLPTSTT